jgi:hypothetical protein
MESVGHTENREQTCQSGRNKSAEFMLNEIEYARQGIYFYNQRFETQISYLLAGLAAMVSTTGVLLTLDQSIIQQAALVVLSSAAWFYSTAFFTRLCATRSSMVMKLAHERRAQEYFLKLDPELRIYSSRTTLSSALQMDSYVFRPITTVLFGALAVFSAMLGSSAGVIALLLFAGTGVFQLAGQARLIWSVSLGLVAFFATVGWCWFVFSRRRQLARKYVDNYLGGLIKSLEKLAAENSTAVQQCQNDDIAEVAATHAQ